MYETINISLIFLPIYWVCSVPCIMLVFRTRFESKMKIVNGIRVTWCLVVTCSKVETIRANRRAGAINFFKPSPPHSLSGKTEPEYFFLSERKQDKQYLSWDGRAGVQYLCNRWVTCSEKTWCSRSQPKIWVTSLASLKGRTCQGRESK